MAKTRTKRIDKSTWKVNVMGDLVDPNYELHPAKMAAIAAVVGIGAALFLRHGDVLLAALTAYVRG